MSERDLTRRDVLAAGAGALGAAALSGCPLAGISSKKSDGAAGVSSSNSGVIVRKAIPGGFAGQDPARGHLLRSGELTKKAIDETIEVPILIVGAGVAGLATAWRLRREGIAKDDVVVLELADQAGGNATSGANSVSPHPWGAHYLRAPTSESRGLATFLEEIQVVRGKDKKGRPDFDTRYVCSDPVERIHEGGIWGEGLFPPPRSGTSADVAELARFRAELRKLAKFRDAEGRRAFAIPVQRSTNDRSIVELDALSFAEWLDADERGAPYESKALRWYLEYACRDDYGSTLETTSAWAGLHYFLARGLEDEEPGEDALERDTGTTLVWPEGNGFLVKKLLEARGGARVLTGQVVFRLDPGSDDRSPEAHVWDLKRERAIRYRARRLVYAGPRFLLSKLLEHPPLGLEDFVYVPWLVCNLALSKAPGGIGAPLAWDNVLYESPSLGYVVATRDRRPDEKHVITWYHAFAEVDLAQARQKLFAMSFDEARAMCLDDLERAHPGISNTVERLDAWRWGHAMIRPGPGQVWSFGRYLAQKPLGRILTANSDKGGLPIFEEAFFQGALAGEQTLSLEGKPFVSIL